MRRPPNPAVIVSLGCALGLLIVFYPMVLSGFRLTHGGLGDARLINYTLEHGYRWLTQVPGHESFWDPPLFYPYPNVSAFTEVMLGVGPYFWFWRAVGFRPDTAFQLWLLTVWGLNYGASYLLLRRGVGIGAISSVGGALVFAFGATAQTHFGHPQLAPLFYVALSLLALLKLVENGDAEERRGRRRAWIVIFFSGWVLQAFTCFYTFFFFGLLSAISILLAALWPGPRLAMKRLVLRHRWPIFWSMLGATLILGYLANHYLVIADAVGLRTYNPDELPSLASWIRVHGRNDVWGDLSRWVRQQGWSPGAGRNGMGLITLGLSIYGFYRNRSKPMVRLLLLGCATLMIVATSWGGHSLWKYVHAVIPGAAALRVVWRVGIILRLPAAVGVALGLQALLEKRRRALASVLMTLCLLEMLHGHVWIDKLRMRQRIASLSELVDPDSEAFFMVCSGPTCDPHVAENAEWVSLQTGVPTINGRYGNYPPEWGLEGAQANAVVSEAQRVEYQAALDRWCDETGLPRDRVQWIEYEREKIPQVRSGFRRRLRARR